MRILFWSAAKQEINMARSVTSLSSESDVEGQAVNFALQVIERENITIREKQMQILRSVIVEKKDALAVLPTGFGSIKSVYLDCQIQIFVKDSRFESCTSFTPN